MRWLVWYGYVMGPTEQSVSPFLYLLLSPKPVLRPSFKFSPSPLAVALRLSASPQKRRRRRFHPPVSDSSPLSSFFGGVCTAILGTFCV